MFNTCIVRAEKGPAGHPAHPPFLESKILDSKRNMWEGLSNESKFRPFLRFNNSPKFPSKQIKLLFLPAEYHVFLPAEYHVELLHKDVEENVPFSTERSEVYMWESRNQEPGRLAVGWRSSACRRRRTLIPKCWASSVKHIRAAEIVIKYIVNSWRAQYISSVTHIRIGSFEIPSRPVVAG